MLDMIIYFLELEQATVRLLKTRKGMILLVFRLLLVMLRSNNLLFFICSSVSAKQIKISAKTNWEQIMKSSLKRCQIKMLLNEKQLCSQKASFMPTSPPTSHKSLQYFYSLNAFKIHVRIKEHRSFYLFHCKDLTPRQRGSCSFGVCCLYTNIPQEEGIGVVCHYGEHYQSKCPMPTSFLGELMRLIQF